MTRVLYVLGSGRCGSSVLGALLGSAPDAVYAGELRHGAAGPCACRMDPCPLWSRVGDPRPAGIAESLWASPWALGRRADGRADVDIVRAVGAAAGATWVVDSSKTPARLARLSRDLPVLPIWLVRGAAGVIASATGRRGAEAQPGRSLARVLAWDLASTIACREAARRFGALVLRWEDVASDPLKAAISVRDAGGPDATDAARRLLSGEALPSGHPRAANRALSAGTWRWQPPDPTPEGLASRLAAAWR